MIWLWEVLINFPKTFTYRVQFASKLRNSWNRRHQLLLCRMQNWVKQDKPNQDSVGSSWYKVCWIKKRAELVTQSPCNGSGARLKKTRLDLAWLRLRCPYTKPASQGVIFEKEWEWEMRHRERGRGVQSLRGWSSSKWLTFQTQHRHRVTGSLGHLVISTDSVTEK